MNPNSQVQGLSFSPAAAVKASSESLKRHRDLPPQIGPCRLERPGESLVMLSPFASLHRKSPHAGHSRESGNPPCCGPTWTPALRQAQGKLFAGDYSNGDFHLVGWKRSNCSSEFPRMAYNRIGSERMLKVASVVRRPWSVERTRLGAGVFPHLPPTIYHIPSSSILVN